MLLATMDGWICQYSLLGSALFVYPTNNKLLDYQMFWRDKCKTLEPKRSNTLAELKLLNDYQSLEEMLTKLLVTIFSTIVFDIVKSSGVNVRVTRLRAYLCIYKRVFTSYKLMINNCQKANKIYVYLW
jgi:hypothetical protein